MIYGLHAYFMLEQLLSGTGAPTDSMASYSASSHKGAGSRTAAVVKVRQTERERDRIVPIR